MNQAHAKQIADKFYEELPVPPVAGGILRRRAGTPAEDVSEDLRLVRFVASDGSVDRFGDVIEPDGWDLRNFKSNPILLWMHNHALGPIGNVVTSGPDAIAVKNGKLVATANFASENLSEPVQRLRLWEQVKAKLLRTFSISARPLEAPVAMRDKSGELTGYRYPKVELLEISLVSVPANPNAIVLARSLGLEESDIQQVFEGGASAEYLKAYYDVMRVQIPATLTTPPRQA